MNAVRLSDFMPYGAPELLEAQRPNMGRALTLASLSGLLLFALAWGVSGWLVASHSSRRPVIDSVELFKIAPPPPSIRVEQPPPPVAPARPLKAAAAVPVPVPETQARPDQTVMSQEDLSRAAPPATKTGTGVVVAPEVGEGPANLPGEVPLVDQLPEPILHPTPDYPDLARQANVEGLVMVNVLVGKDGRVKDVRLHPRLNVPMLNQAALEAARKWTFQPALQAGHPVSVWVSMPFRFKLH